MANAVVTSPVPAHCFVKTIFRESSRRLPTNKPSWQHDAYKSTDWAYFSNYDPILINLHIERKQAVLLHYFSHQYRQDSPANHLQSIGLEHTCRRRTDWNGSLLSGPAIMSSTESLFLVPVIQEAGFLAVLLNPGTRTAHWLVVIFAPCHIPLGHPGVKSIWRPSSTTCSICTSGCPACSQMTNLY